MNSLTIDNIHEYKHMSCREIGLDTIT